MLSFPELWMLDLPIRTRVRVLDPAGRELVNVSALSIRLMFANGQALGSSHFLRATVHLSVPRPWSRTEWRTWFALAFQANARGGAASLEPWCV